jgi:anaerobic magnesium-protoporphyrin IX monomethyl ester cyclase
MNVLLIALNSLEFTSSRNRTIPVPLLHLTANLAAHGHQPRILDFSVLTIPENADPRSYSFALLEDIIGEHKSTMVGINCFTSMHFPMVREFAKSIKANHPDLPVVVGGVHPTLFPKEILENCPEIDFVVVGEGEDQIVALADRFNVVKDFSDVQALAWRNSDRAVVVNPRISFIKDLSSRPIAAWKAICLEDYCSDHSTWYNPKSKNIRLSVPILTSRSCPFKCNFCTCYANMGRTFRRCRPDLVVDEIEHLYAEQGQNYFRILDDNFVLIKKHVMDICQEIIRRNIDIQIEASCGLHIASLDEELIATMAEAGVVYAALPIEHGNDWLRNQVIGKNLPRKDIFTVASLLKKYNILTSGAFVMGFPEDTRETLDDTYRLILELELDLNYVLTLIPFSGSAVFEQARKNRLFTDSLDKENLWAGQYILDGLQKASFYIKPYNMTLDDLADYRSKFDKLKFFSKRAKSLNGVE